MVVQLMSLNWKEVFDKVILFPPFLFLLAAEGVHVLMNALVEKGMYTGYGARAQNANFVSHL